MTAPAPKIDRATLETLRASAEAAARAGGDVLRGWFGRDDLPVHEKAENDFVTQADQESERAVLDLLRARHADHVVLAEESGVLELGAPPRPLGESGEWRLEWVIDPLDGTSNFLQGVPFFCVSVACRLRRIDTTIRSRGELLVGAVYDPVRDEMFSGARGLGATREGATGRRSLALSQQAGIDGAFVATGYPFRVLEAIDLYWGLFRDVSLRARGLRRMGAAALELAYLADGRFDGFFELRLQPWDLAAGLLLLGEVGGVASDFDGHDDPFVGGNVLAGPSAVHDELLDAARRHLSEASIEATAPLG